jgi:hypothetical protein
VTSKRCGLRKEMCPGSPIIGNCPFDRADCLNSEVRNDDPNLTTAAPQQVREAASGQPKRRLASS